ncbi:MULTISPECIES: site-specific integrase [unclassified Burkholderia]|uniref:tyrosine-type recombinase/integrase n=1 Tax=unclassified Burkholderia TaxID=2613784 RepID=UPI001420FD0C|nr:MULTISPECIES: site-specific integrase [unclassified Burkholderia]
MKALTALGLKGLTPTDDGRVLRDTGNLKGRVRLGKSGRISVSFAYTYKREGKFHELSCGTWPTAALGDIRLKRDAARRLIQQGIDPAQEKRATKLRARAEQSARITDLESQLARPTVRKLFEEWADKDLTKRKDKGAETRRGFEKDVMPVMGTRYAADVTRANVMCVLDRARNRGAMRLANRLLAELRQMFGFAVVRELIPSNPAAGIEKKHAGGKETERNRTLSTDELRALPKALCSSGLPEATRHAVWLMLATGARVGELSKARRADIDVDAGTWRIPAEHSKNAKPHTIFLSPFALEHVEALLAISDSNIWLMPAARGESHIDCKSITKQIADRQLRFCTRDAHAKRTVKHAHALELGNEKWTSHDLRRTAATLMQSLNVLPEVIERTLNHVDENRIRRTYQTYNYEPQMREAWQKLGTRLELLSAANSENVAVLQMNVA